MNKLNRYSSFGKSNNSQNGKVAANTFGFKKKGKGIQCHECEGFGHIQSECANILKKKGKSLNTNWSDEESEGSQEDDEDQVRNYVAFNIVTNCDIMKDYVIIITKSVATPVATSGTIATPAATSSATLDEFDDSRSECNSDDDLSNEEIQSAYKEMYNKLIQVCRINKSLEIRVVELHKEKDVVKKAVINYKFLATEKERKL
ncbi:hypothetical protein TIFTF001_014175 [Ficus carica]|uniref:CCHC-type domain-containing protein n=1 Tax=Ficus carica TaxID=3494 RepID=A0AA88D6S0_FICCA|nr:hypothetical protein TIFTF001_014175 [Ficus carica]